MTPDAAPIFDATPVQMGEASRLAGVFFEPGKTFADVVERPRWVVPLLLIILSGIAFLYAFSNHVGWERYMHRMLDNNPRMQQLAPEQRERIFERQTKALPIYSYVGTVIGTPLAFLVIAAILMGLVKGVLGVPVAFKQVFAVCCYASVPSILLRLLSILVMFLKEPDDFNLQNPFVSNPGALMDPDSSSKFLYSLASSLDVFTIWIMLLIAVGLKAAGGKRLSFAGALFAVLLPWAVWVLGRAALAAAFNFG